MRIRGSVTSWAVVLLVAATVTERGSGFRSSWNKVTQRVSPQQYDPFVVPPRNTKTIVSLSAKSSSSSLNNNNNNGENHNKDDIVTEQPQPQENISPDAAAFVQEEPNGGTTNPSLLGRLGKFVKPRRTKIRKAATATLAAVALGAGTAGTAGPVTKGIARTVAVSVAAGAGSVVAQNAMSSSTKKQSQGEEEEEEEETMSSGSRGEPPLPLSSSKAEQEAVTMMKQAEQAREKTEQVLGQPPQEITAPGSSSSRTAVPNDFMSRKPPFASKTIGASMGLGSVGNPKKKNHSLKPLLHDKISNSTSNNNNNNNNNNTPQNSTSSSSNYKNESYQSLLEECMAMEARIQQTNEKLKRLEERELRAKQIIEQQEAAMAALTKKAVAATSTSASTTPLVGNDSPLLQDEKDRQLLQSIKDARIAKTKAQAQALERAKSAKFFEQSRRAMLAYRFERELVQKERSRTLQLQQEELRKELQRQQMVAQQNEQSRRQMMQYRFNMETRLREEWKKEEQQLHERMEQHRLQKIQEKEEEEEQTRKRKELAKTQKLDEIREKFLQEEQFQLQEEARRQEELAETQKLQEMIMDQQKQAEQEEKTRNEETRIRKKLAEKQKLQEMKEKFLQKEQEEEEKLKLQEQARRQDELAEKQKLQEKEEKRLQKEQEEKQKLQQEARMQEELAEKRKLQEMEEKRLQKEQEIKQKLQEEARRSSVKTEQTARLLLTYRLELDKRIKERNLKSESSVPFFVGESQDKDITSTVEEVVANEKVPEEEVTLVVDEGLEQKGSIISDPEITIDDGAVVAESPVQLDMGSFVIPHPDKVSFGGEDAAFIKGSTFGVFDGVTGAEKLEGMPLYSKTMKTEMESRIGEKGLTIDEITDIMTTAAEIADSDATGATTAIVASITDDGYLQALNLGDSMCCVIRDNEVIARSENIVHFFNCPYQLCEYGEDRPIHGTKLDVPILSGDVIIMGSDGLFDNISEKTICKAIRDLKYESSEFISEYLAYMAQEISFDEEAVTPNALEWRKNGIPNCVGGKLDDISCIVIRCS